MDVDFWVRGVALALLAPVVIAILWNLRRGAGDAVAAQTAFCVTGRGVTDPEGRPLTPRFVSFEFGYYTTGPASGYLLGSLWLGLDDGTILENRYTEQAPYDADYHRLVTRMRLPAIDAILGKEEPDGTFRAVRFNGALAALLLSGSDRYDNEGREVLERFDLKNQTRKRGSAIDPAPVGRWMRQATTLFADRLDADPPMRRKIDAALRLTESADGAPLTLDAYERVWRQRVRNSPPGSDVNLQDGTIVVRPPA